MTKTSKKGRTIVSSLSRLTKWVALIGIVLFSANQAMAGWSYSHPTITDGMWILVVRCDNGKDLVITGVSTAPGSPAPLDFSDYSGPSIVEIEPNVFEYNSEISSLVLPNTVTNIGSYAFSGCEALTGDLVIPDSVVSIDNHAFGDCAFDGALILGNSLRSIGYYIVVNSHFTESLALPDSLEFVEGGAFGYCTFKDVSSWGTLDTIPDGMFVGTIFMTDVFVIPNQITTIGPSAFSSCDFTGAGTKDGWVVVGNGVNTIGNGAFLCSEMSRISLPSTDVTIDSAAFMDIISPDGIYFRGRYPAGVETDIYDNYYDPPVCINSTFVKNIYVDDWNPYTGLNDIQSIYFGNWDFWLDCPIYAGDWDWDAPYLSAPEWKFVRSFEYPVSNGYIYNSQGWMFWVDADGSNLTLTGVYDTPRHISSLDFSSSITEITGGYAGNACSIVQIGDGIGSRIFGSYTDLMVGSLVLPNTVTNIDDYALMNLYNVTGDLVIPDSVVLIGVFAFEMCAFDGELILGNSLKSIGEYAFQECEYFTGSLALPDSLEFVGIRAFANCTFEDVSSWGTLDTIFDGSFAGVTFLTDVFVIPNQITTIGAEAFSAAYFGDGSGAMGNGSVVIGNGVTSIRDWAFAGAAAERFSVPSTGVSLEDYAFSGLYSEKVYYRGEYPSDVEATIYYYAYATSSFIKTDYVSSWEVETQDHDIGSGSDEWRLRPIFCDDWDWDEPYLEPLDSGPSEMPVIVSAIAVSGGDVTLAWDFAQVEAVFGAGAGYTYAIEVSTNLSLWCDCPVFSLLTPGAGKDAVAILDANMPVSNQRFFKVRAVKTP